MYNLCSASSLIAVDAIRNLDGCVLVIRKKKYEYEYEFEYFVGESTINTAVVYCIATLSPSIGGTATSHLPFVFSNMLAVGPTKI
jgi:hypothetical protein